MIVSMYRVATGDWLCNVAANQSSYKLVVSRPRGMIYDYKKRPLVGLGEKDVVATIMPTIESINYVKKLLPKEESDKILEKFSLGYPFRAKMSRGLGETDDIKVFEVPGRYSKEQLLPHLIGYVDDDGNGVSGIEYCFDDILKNTGAEVSVRYRVDALGRALKGEKTEIDNTLYLQTRGVVLTIDRNIQELTQKVAKKFMKKGAVIVTEIPTCKVRACVSVPDFSPLNLEQALQNEDSPFVNRAFASYNVGSVFKLVTAAAALEAGIDPSYSYDCCGHLDVEGTMFHCFNGGAHHLVDMKGAITYSCNTYFIKLSEMLKPRQIVQMANSLGFDKEMELARELTAEKGNIPSVKQLKDKKNLANFSFGQGSLMATPLQISGLINAIASGGVYSQPTVVEGLVNENLDYTEKFGLSNQDRVMSEKTAEFLMDSMRSSVENGTSTQGKPSNNGAGAKTATAETGIINNDHKVIQAWYAGFYPACQPRYSIVVLTEDGVGGGESCGPVFKTIADDLESFIDK